MLKVASLALVVCLALGGSALAADTKIGVFNSQSIAIDSEPGKAARQKLESQFGAEKTQLEKQFKDMQSKAESLQAQMATLSQKAREEKQRDFMNQRRDFEEKSRNFTRKVESFELQIRQNLAKILFEASQNVSKNKSLNLILDSGTGAVFFVTPDLDVTKDMLAEVNRLWKAGGSKFDEPKAPAKAPAKKK